MATLALSMDGGGIRGVVSAILLDRLLDAVPGWLYDVTCFAGTSTGGILACGLASGLTPSVIRDLYLMHGPVIFHRSLPLAARDLWSLVEARYDDRTLSAVLLAQFGGRLLRDLPRKIVVPTFRLDNGATVPFLRTWAPKVWHNFSGMDSDGDVPVWKVATYTSVAPTYFPSVDGYIDGGVYAANPAMVALAQLLDVRNEPTPDLKDIWLLSLGTGGSPRYISGQRGSWGVTQWMPSLIPLLLEGTAGIADFQVQQLLGARYHRLAPVFPPPATVDPDDVGALPYLVEFAQQVELSGTVEWLQRWQGLPRTA